MTEYVVPAGQSATYIVLSSGNVETTTPVVLSTGDTEDVYGTAISTTATGGGIEYVFAGGTASGTTLNGYLVVDASGVTTEAGGEEFVDGTAISTTVNSYGTEYVNSGGTATGTTVNAGGFEFVQFGGTAISTTLSGGGDFFTYEIVEDGGTASSTTVNGRNSIEIVSSGGTAVSATLNSGGSQYVSAGGTASSTTVNGGGSAYVFSSGTADSTTVNSNGTEYVSAGGTASRTTVNGGGSEYVFSSGTADSTTVNSNGIEYVSTGGTASSTTVNSDGKEVVSSGGAAINTVVNAGGQDDVETGATATGTTANNGTEDVYSGGSAISAMVNSGGVEAVYSGGTAVSAMINSDGFEFVFSSGTASGTAINSNGIEYIESSGTAVSTTIDGGFEFVFSGGTASGTTVNSGGYQKVFGGTAVSTTVNNGGEEVVSGGTISATSVSVGGEILLETVSYVSGETAVISAGTLLVSSGGTILYSQTLAGNYTGDYFSVTSTASGTLLTLEPSRSTESSGALSITAPTSATVGVGEPDPISGVNLVESPITADESFTVTLSDTNGLLSVTGTDVSGLNTTSLTITGTLNDVNAALGTLTDNDASTALDTITVNASDTNGGRATASFGVTVNGMPVVSATSSSATLQQNQATAVTGVSISETGNTSLPIAPPTDTSVETFTAVLTDTNGVLSATSSAVGGGGTVTPSNGGTTLTIYGTLVQVDADLTTLTDDDPSTAADTITVSATDSFGNKAAPPSTIDVTVSPAAIAPGTLSIMAPTAATIGINRAHQIGVSILASPTTDDETFTVTLSDTFGVLSATASDSGDVITPSDGGTTLAISGTYAQVNEVLATLTDDDGTTPSDTITVDASDSNGGSATASIAVTVNGLPVIKAPATASTAAPSVTSYAPGVGPNPASVEKGQTVVVATVTPVNPNDSVSLALLPGNGAEGTVSLGPQQADGTYQVTYTAPAAIPVSTADPVGFFIFDTQLGQMTPVGGVSISETGDTSNEMFTVTLTDTSGVLSATFPDSGGGGVITLPNEDNPDTLIISGTLDQVNADLTTLTDDNGGTPDTITVTVDDSLGNANANPPPTIAVLSGGRSLPITIPEPLDAGPSLTTQTPSVIEQGQATVIGTATPGLPGDILKLTKASSGLTLNSSGQIVYTAPPTTTSQNYTVSYTIADQHNDATVSGVATVVVDGGPSIAQQTPSSVENAQSTIIGVVTPGLAGDTLTLTQTAGTGKLGLGPVQTNGTQQVIYTAPAIVSASTIDKVAYTVADQHKDDTATGSASVQLVAAPLIAAPGTVTVGVAQTNPIGGVSVSESPTTPGETFTAVLTDTNGMLSATTSVTGGGGTITPSNAGKTLTISGTLVQVNADLTTLADDDASTAADKIVIAASDSNGGTATPASIAVTVNGVPVIAVPTSATVRQNKATAVTGVSVSEPGNTTTSGETFTAVLTDTNGMLSATTSGTGGGGTITPSNGGKTLTISGTLAQINADLTTLADNDGPTAADTIAVTAKDSFGNAAASKSITVAVTPSSGLPSITAPKTATVGVGQSTAINGISISESPTTTSETFTAVLTDANGVLSATTSASGGGGTITPSNGGKALTISGTLAQVNADLTTLADNDGSTAADTIMITANDSNGGSATAASIAVTVTGVFGNGSFTVGLSGSNNVVTLDDGNSKVSGGQNSNVIVAGNGNSTVSLSGNSNSITLGNGNGIVTLGGNNNSVRLGNGNETVTVAGGGNKVGVGNGNSTVTLGGGGNTVTAGNGNDTITLAGSGSTVTLGNGIDTVHGGTGDTVNLANTTLNLYGTEETVFISTKNATVNDYSTGLNLKIGPTAGVDVLAHFASDLSGAVDLIGGIGGFKTTAAVLSALKSDGQGGTLLLFGTGSSLDFTGVAPGQLHTSNFQIG